MTSGSSSPLTPGAGDATQAAKDGVPGTPSDSRPPNPDSPNDDRARAIVEIHAARQAATSAGFEVSMRREVIEGDPTPSGYKTFTPGRVTYTFREP